MRGHSHVYVGGIKGGQRGPHCLQRHLPSHGRVPGSLRVEPRSLHFKQVPEMPLPRVREPLA